jgi:glycosyltransferase involved in cell wall biosynthesis
MDLYFDASILQSAPFAGCQVYCLNILREMIDLAPEHTFHLHFAMDGWHPSIDTLRRRQNTRVHRFSGAFGRHLAVSLNILKTRSRVHYIMNGNTGRLRVPVPCPTAAVFHDLRFALCPEIYGQQNSERFIREVASWISRRDCIVTGTETVKREIMDMFKLPAASVLVASEAAEHQELSQRSQRPEKLAADARYFLLVNPGEVRKNWQDALEGFSQYLRDHSDDTSTLLVLAGGLRDQASPIEQRVASDARLNGRVLSLGYVSDEELRYLYQNARLSVYPSRYEGFGIPVLESMNLGLPVVVSDIPVFREVAGDAARFVPLDRPDLIAEALALVHADTPLRDTMIERGRLRAAAYSWRASAERTLDMLLRLGSRRSS